MLTGFILARLFLVVDLFLRFLSTARQMVLIEKIETNFPYKYSLLD